MKGMSETVSTASNAAGAWTNPLRDPRDLRLPRIAGPCSIVIFGVTGDLSRKNCFPQSTIWPTVACCRQASV